MKEYELSILFNKDCSVEYCERYIANMLTDKKYKFEDDGVKRLAYPVEGEEKARYIYVSNLYLTDTETSLLSETLNLLSETLYSRQDKQGVLRFLLVKVDKRAGNWNNYIEYLKDWARQHEEIENDGMSPACYDEFLDNEKGDF